MTKRDILYLGSLLHDIGKFVFRSQPTQSGQNHEALGENFVREYLVKKFYCFLNYEKEILNAVNRGLPIIKYADEIAAKERQSQKSVETRRPLYSIFKYINTNLDDNYINNDYVYYLEPKPLDENPFYPVKITQKSEEWHPDEKLMIEQHKESLEKFKQELTEIAANGDNIHTQAILKTLYALLWKYTSNISSASYKSEPDISLFDHSRSVAAIASCLQEADDITTPILLLKGDISGIQKFIYSEIKDTDGAAKKLRGRSFFIKLISETLCNFIIRSFDLYDANIIYNSGGSFEIILPSNQINKQKIEELEKYINQSLFNLFGAELQLIIAWKEFPANEFFTSYNEIQDTITQLLANKKKKKSFSILDQLFNTRFEQKELEKAESLNLFEELGQQIPYSDYIIEIYSDTPLSKLNDNNYLQDYFLSKIIPLENFNTYWLLVNKQNEIELAISSLKKLNPKEITIYNINNTNIGINAKITRLFNDLPIGLSFKFIANYAPIKIEKNKVNLVEFSELAKISAENYPLLGILRMDVDNLGYIFKNGMKGQSYSIMRMSSLSRQLDLFFSRDVNLLAKEHGIYITYSGGDDLFVVGSWVKIIDFAIQLKENFFKYTAENPNITLSGGIALTKDNFPIAKSAILSGNQEDLAKKSKLTDEKYGQKDKISIFDIPMRWDEFKTKINISKQISSITITQQNKSEGITTAMIYKILSYVKQTFKNDGSLDLDKMYRLSANLAYLFARRKINPISNKEKNDALTEIKKLLLDYFLRKSEEDKKRWYSTFPVIGNYVILKNRKQKYEK